MKKIILFLGALCCSVLAFAEWEVETSKTSFLRPQENPPLLSDFAFNPNTGVVGFTDIYHQEEELARFYAFYVHKRYDNSLFFKAQWKNEYDRHEAYNPGFWYLENYNYGRKGKGECGYSSDCIVKKLVDVYGFMTDDEILLGLNSAPYIYKYKNSKGGRVTGTVEKDGAGKGWLYDMYASGHTSFRIFVRPFELYRGEKISYMVYLTDDGVFDYNAWMRYYFDVDIPSARVVDTLWTAIETHNQMEKRHYDIPYKCPVLIQSGKEVTFTWQFRHADTEKWMNMKPQTIKASEAKKGYLTEWNGGLSYQIGYDRLLLRLRLEVKVSEKQTDTIFVDVPSVQFEYPTYSGTNTWWNTAGTVLPTFSKNWRCKKYNFYTEDGKPFRIVENTNTWITIMQPASAFHADLVDATYEVNFYDFDGKLLKHETVDCSEAADAPDAPTHAGYEFKGWSQNFDSVVSDMDIYAQYDGFSSFGNFTIEQTRHTSNYPDMQGSATRIAYDDFVTFSINVKAISVVSVWMQRTLDGGKSWITNGGITTLSAADVTKAEGCDFTTTFHLQDNIGQPSVGFRLCLKCNDTEIYTNAIFYDMCYPIVVTPNEKFDETLLVSNSDRSDLISVARGQDTLMTVVGDTVWFREMTGNDAALVLSEKRTQLAKQAETGNNYLVCSNDNQISYALLMHTVWYEVLGIDSKAEYGFNNIFTKEEVAHGKAATMDKIPVDPFDAEGAYHFAYWMDENTGEQADLSHVTDDMWLMAEFEENYVPEIFTVTFRNWDNTLLGTQQVEEGREADFFAFMPEREGYTFAGWDVDLSIITKDVTATAQYVEFIGKHTVVATTSDFKMGFTTRIEEYETDATATIEAFPWDGYVFVRWMMYDAETNDWVEVSRSKVYTFTVTKSVAFKAEFASASGMSNVESDESMQVKKITYNGALYIIRNGKIYNAQGMVVK